MPYIGNTIRAADDYRLIDDISSGFNGSETSFALQVAGSAPVPFPKSPQQVLISVNGVIQEPDPTGASGFNLVGTNIVFSSAPTNGHAFFGIIYATADYLNAGGNFPSGSLGAPSITFIGDENSGLYRKSGGSVGFVSDATEIANFDSNGITISSGSLIIPDSIIHNGDPNTKIRFSGADTVSVETAGTQRLEVASDGKINFGSVARVEADGVFKAAHGDASTPSYNFLNDNDNGMFRATTNTIGFSTAGTERLRVDSSGRVQIGTAVGWGSNCKLHVSDTSSNCFITISAADDGNSVLAFSDTAATVRGALDYDHADDSLLIKTAATEALRIDSSGRLLVGTSTTLPAFGASSALQVAGTGFSDGSILIRRDSNNAFSGALVFGKSRGSLGGNTIVQDDDQVGVIIWTAADGTDLTTDLAQIKARIDGTPGSNDMPGRLEFHTTADGASGVSERMRIDSSGNVGIATTSGGGKLAILSNSSSYEGLELQTPSGDGSGEFHIGVHQSGATSGRTIVFKRGGADGMDTESMRIDNSGNVGIGESSPSHKLHISADESTTIAYFDTALGGRGLKINTFVSGSAASAGVEFEAPAGANKSAFVFKGASEFMRIDTAGRVGIGTSSPSHALHVVSSGTDTALFKGRIIKFDGAAASDSPRTVYSLDGTDKAQILLHRTTDEIDIETMTAKSIKFKINSSEKVRIDSSGNVGIGTTSPSRKLDVVGDAEFIHDNGISIEATSTGTAGQLTIIGVNNSDQVSAITRIKSVSTDSSSAATATTFSNRNSSNAVNEHMRIDSSGNVGIGTTSPSRKLEVNSGSTDTVAKFESTDSAAIINFVDSGDSNGVAIGAVGGAMTFRTGLSTERMKIHSSGIVTMSSTPAFQAKSLSNAASNAATTNSNEFLVFNTVNLNQGGDYDNSNGRFTAPVDGIYFFTCMMLVDNNASTNANYLFSLTKNGSTTTFIRFGYDYRVDQRSGNYGPHMSGSGAVSLDENDYVQVYNHVAGMHTGGEAVFTGFLIG